MAVRPEGLSSTQITIAFAGERMYAVRLDAVVRREARIQNIRCQARRPRGKLGWSNATSDGELTLGGYDRRRKCRRPASRPTLESAGKRDRPLVADVTGERGGRSAGSASDPCWFLSAPEGAFATTNVFNSPPLNSTDGVR
jgi:hypothetical protein